MCSFVLLFCCFFMFAASPHTPDRLGGWLLNQLDWTNQPAICCYRTFLCVVVLLRGTDGRKNPNAPPPDKPHQLLLRMYVRMYVWSFVNIACNFFMQKRTSSEPQQSKTPEERLKDIEDAKAALRSRVALRKAASQQASSDVLLGAVWVSGHRSLSC